MNEVHKRVRISVAAEFARVTPFEPSWLEQSLRMTEFRPELDGNGHLQMTRVATELYLLEDEICRVMPGHVPRLATYLRSNGIPVEIVDQRRFVEGYRHDPAAIEFSNGRSRTVMQTIGAAPHGQVLVGSERQRWRVIERLCRLFPSSRILFVVARSQDVEPLQRRLDRLRRQFGLTVSAQVLGFEVISQERYRWQSNFDLTWHLQVFLDETPMNRGVLENADGWLLCRRYAVLMPRRRNDAEQMAIEALVGPVILDLNKSPDELLALAFWVPMNGRQQRESAQNALVRKRERIWRNAPRNRTLTELALAFRNHDRRTLRQLPLGDFNLDSWYQQSNHMPRVAILTETLEHAESLGQRLREWDVVGVEPEPPTKVRTTFRMGHSLIVTMSAAHKFGFDADVIIRADGTATPFDKEWINRRPRDYRKPTLIVDLDERFDDEARRATAARRANYTALGV